MSRTINDPELQIWEAYATSGDFGFPDHSRMVFHCLSDRTRKARFVERQGNKAEVERELTTLSDQELAEILEGAPEVK